MMKKLLSIILALLLTLSLAACGSGGGGGGGSEPAKELTGSGTAEDPIVLTFAAHFSNTIDMGQIISQVKEILEEKSGGTMTLDMYFNEALMKQSDTFIGVGQGVADIAYIPSQNLSDVQMAGIFKLLYPQGALDINSMTKIYREAVANTQFQENLEQYNMYCLTARALGGKQLATASKLVTHPEDLAGMNIAANGNDAFFFTACNAGAVALSNADYYTGLSNGMVDGLTNHYASLYTYNLYEVADYITEFASGLEVAAETYMINLDTWNALTAEQQQYVADAFTEVSDMMVEYDGGVLEENRQEIIDYGVEVYTLSGEELAAFEPYMTQVNSDWIETAAGAGWDAQAAYDLIMGEVEATHAA